MVPKKKAAKKVQGTTEPIEEPVSEEETAILPISALQVPDDTLIEEPKTELPIKEPTASFVDETGKLLKLLGDRPSVPYITNIHEAVAFVDKYTRWDRDVKAATT